MKNFMLLPMQVGYGCKYFRSKCFEVVSSEYGGRWPPKTCQQTKCTVWRDQIHGLEFHKISFKWKQFHHSLNNDPNCICQKKLDKSKFHQPVGLTTFRSISNSKLNISLGYYRKNTCSNCDLLKTEISVLEEKL